MFQFAEIGVQRFSRVGKRPAQRFVRIVQTRGNLDRRAKRAAAHFVKYAGFNSLYRARQSQARKDAVGTEDRVAVGFMKRCLHGQRAVPIHRRGAAKIGQAFEHQNALSSVRKPSCG